jgi:predicted ArsR family transcriptional regulator
MVAERLLAPKAREESLAPPSRGGSRAAILRMLRGEARPLDIREVAQRTGLHQNTARFHLEALVAAGLAARETEDRETP